MFVNSGKHHEGRNTKLNNDLTVNDEVERAVEDEFLTLTTNKEKNSKRDDSVF
jgi:hypothetical protein